MKSLLFTIAAGAIIVSAPAAAQDRHANGVWNQQVTRQQAQQMADVLFQRFDLNHDGVVTIAEAQKASEQIGADSERAGRMLQRIFGNAQSITRQQFETQSLARFDAMDRNHDGVVTSEERAQARAEMKAQRASQNGGQ